MRRSPAKSQGWTRPLATAAIVLLPACGISTEQYDARVAELRKAEEKAKGCDDLIKAEEVKVSDSKADLEEMRTLVREMQKERKELGITSAADVARLKQAQADAGRPRAAAPIPQAPTVERQRLAQSFKAEMDAGLISFDDRGGVLRVVLPEEALFTPTTAKVTSNGKKVLDAIVREIKAMPPRGIMVSSFTDKTDKSKADKDMALTLDRAWHVGDYMGSQGVDKSLVGAAGYGELEPIVDNANDALRIKNRRVEITFLAPVPVAGAPRPAGKGGADDPGL